MTQEEKEMLERGIRALLEKDDPKQLQLLIDPRNIEVPLIGTDERPLTAAIAAGGCQFAQWLIERGAHLGRDETGVGVLETALRSTSPKRGKMLTTLLESNDFTHFEIEEAAFIYASLPHQQNPTVKRILVKAGASKQAFLLGNIVGKANTIYFETDINKTATCPEAATLCKGADPKHPLALRCLQDADGVEDIFVALLDLGFNTTNEEDWFELAGEAARENQTRALRKLGRGTEFFPYAKLLLAALEGDKASLEFHLELCEITNPAEWCLCHTCRNVKAEALGPLIDKLGYQRVQYLALPGATANNNVRTVAALLRAGKPDMETLKVAFDIAEKEGNPETLGLLSVAYYEAKAT